MDIPFTKMQSCGNDYIILDYLERNAEASYDKNIINCITPPTIIRRYGIGADGVIMIFNDKNADMYLRFILPDMREEKLSLNGALCAAKYIYEKGYIFKDTLKIKTDYGILEANLFINEKEVISCEISTPCIDFSANFASFPKEKGVRHGQIHTQDGTFWFGCVYFGGEYTVVFCDDINSSDIRGGISRLSSNASFKNGSDIVLANVITPTHIIVRTFKRGCGEILSCACSCCSALALAVKKGFCRQDAYILLENSGGNFHIKCDGSYKMHIIGESEFSYEGKYQFSES